MSNFTEAFGRSIQKADADRLFNKLIEIKRHSIPKIMEALVGDDEAIRYYCGRNNENPITEDLAYVFDRQSLSRIMGKVLASEADGLIIFNAVRDENDSVDAAGNKTDVAGRPTLIIFPCTFTQLGENGKTVTSANPILNDGEEHPGTGGEPEGEGNLVVNLEGLPIRFRSVRPAPIDELPIKAL